MYNQMTTYSSNIQPQYPLFDTSSMYTQRLNNMAQQTLNNQNQQMGNFMYNNTGMQMSTNNFNVVAVKKYDEVEKAPITLDGSITIFINFPHGEIYTKQLNLSDGTTPIKTYKLSENPKSTIATADSEVEYVKKAEFDELKARFNEVWEALTSTPSENKKDETKNKKEGK